MTKREQRGPRIKRRVMVRYGKDKADHTAFTKNLSEHGVCLKTNIVFRPGTTLLVQVQFPDRMFGMWAKVIWAKKVPPQLAHVVDCGMGAEFVDPPADYRTYFEHWQQGKV